MAESRTVTIEVVNGLMNVSQVADYVGVPVATVYNLTMKEKIPHFHIGKLLRFRKDKIDEWLLRTECDGSGVNNG